VAEAPANNLGLEQDLSDAVVGTWAEDTEPAFVIAPDRILDVLTRLRDAHGYDFLSNLTCVDYQGYGGKLRADIDARLEIVYPGAGGRVCAGQGDDIAVRDGNRYAVVRRDRRSPVPCIGRRRSQLERRVRRLLDEHRSLQGPSRPRRRVSALGLLALAPLLAPVVAPGADVSHERRNAIEGAWPPEHERAREHEFRERRERGHAWPTQSAPPVREGEIRGTNTTLPSPDRDGM